MSFQTTARDTQRHVFPRNSAFTGGAPYPADGGSISTSALVDQRRQMTLTRIQSLKQSLASIVSSSRGSSPSAPRDDVHAQHDSYTVSLDRPRPGSPSVPHPATTGSPPPSHQRHADSTRVVALTTPSHGGRSFLLDTQRQVERLTLENHELVRRCLELEERMREAETTAAQHSPAQGPTRHEDTDPYRDGAADEEDGLLQDSGAVHSPKDLPFFARYARRPSSVSQRQTSTMDRTSGSGSHDDRAMVSAEADEAVGQLPTALYGLLHRASVCYPELFKGISPASEAPFASLAVPTAAATTSTADVESLQPREDAIVSGLSEVGVCEALWRLEHVLPGLVSSSRLGELFTDTGAELLDRINTLEDEKQADYFKVLDITEKLMSANTQLKQRDAERTLQVSQLTADLEELRQQRSQLVDQLTAERMNSVTATSAAGAKDAQAQTALTEVMAARDELQRRLTELSAEQEKQLANAADEIAAERAKAAAAEERHRAVSEELTTHKAEAAAQLRDLEQQLEEKRAEVEAQATAIDAAMKHVEALSAASAAATESEAAHKAREAAWHRAEEDLTQRCTAAEEALDAKVAEVEALRGDLEAAARRAEESNTLVEKLQEQVQRFTTERDALAAELANRQALTNDSSMALSPEKSQAVDEDGEDEDTTSGENTSGMDPLLRKTKQSLRRMTSERTALKRKLERQGATLTETQEKLSASELQVTMLETELARLRMEKDMNERAATDLSTSQTAAPVAAATTPLRSTRSSPRRTPQRRASAAFALPEDPLRLDFSRLEQSSHPAADAEPLSDLYPPPLPAISAEWLSSVHDIPISVYARDMVEDAQTRLEAGGVFYHVGMRLVQEEGLLEETKSDTGSPAQRGWGRLLRQLQHAVQCRGPSFFSNTAYAADCAQLYYSLLRATRLLGEGSAVSGPVQWALLMAGLCQFVGPVGEDMHQEEEEGLRDAAPGGPSRWRTVQALLEHVAAANANDALGPMVSFYSPAAFPSGASANAEEVAVAHATLQALLTYTDGPLDGLLGCQLHRLVLRCCALVESGGDTAAEDSQEAAAVVTATRAALRPIPVAQLCLRLARESVFVRSSATWPPREQQGTGNRLALYGRHVLRDLTTPPTRAAMEAQGQGWEHSEAEAVVLGERLRLYLDGAVLPLTLTVSRVLALGPGAHHAAGVTLVSLLMRTRAELGAADGETVLSSLLTAEQVEVLVQWFATPSSGATEQELLQLYKENATYRGYIDKLLHSIENK